MLELATLSIPSVEFYSPARYRNGSLPPASGIFPLCVGRTDVPDMEFVTTSTRQSNIEAMQEVQAELLHRRTPAVRLRQGSPRNAALPSATRQLGPFGPARTERVPVGCRTCDHTGYKGRVGIYEFLVFDEAMRRIAREAARTDEMRSLARIGGMRQMQQHALELVKAGRTTLEEVSRVVPFDAVNSLACTAYGSQLGPTFRFCPHCGESQDHHSGTPRPAKPKPALAKR